MNHILSTCVIIGASHAGVQAAFSLRKEGWEGEILLFDQDPNLPYHRPPLSKKYLTEELAIEKNALKPLKSYEKEQIQLFLGKRVVRLDPAQKQIYLSDGTKFSYDKLILAVGGVPYIPPIPGLQAARHVFTLRHAQDADQILQQVAQSDPLSVLVIGGGFIGLEIAASLIHMNHAVTVVERASRILSRVTAPEISAWLHELHTARGVTIARQKEIKQVKKLADQYLLEADDGESFIADIIIIGVGIRISQTLAKQAGLAVSNGIEVNAHLQTSDPDIYAIGDCSWHPNAAYGTYMRLESVPNAVDQAKCAAAHICGKQAVFQAIPWFWSDQFDAKLQMVGLSDAATHIHVRREKHSAAISVWFFQNKHLIAVHAINHPRAYVLGTKLIKTQALIDPRKLIDPEVELTPTNLIAS